MVRVGPKTIRIIVDMIREQLSKYREDISDAYRRATELSISISIKLGKNTPHGMPVDVKISFVNLKTTDEISTVVDEDQLDLFPEKEALDE